MKRILGPRRETLGLTLVYMCRALLAALMCGAQVFGGYAPFAVGAVAAAGPGWEGLAALAGAGLGALALLDFPHALRTMACCVLIFTANNAFCELRAYAKRMFLPVLTAGLVLVVEAIYAYRSGSGTEAAYCLMATLLAGLSADACRLVLRSEDARSKHPAAWLLLVVASISALASAQMANGFAPGRAAAVLTVLLIAFDRDGAAALAAALCMGFAMDIAEPGGDFRHAACYGLGALSVMLLHRGSRVRAALAFSVCAVVFALPLGAREGVALVYECLAGTLAFLLLPSRALRALREEDRATEEDGGSALDGARRRLGEAAQALRELYAGVAFYRRTEEENPAVIFDRAAEAVCRDCTLRALCWEREYGETYNALSAAATALLQEGGGCAEDFPTSFTDRCVRFSSFLAAVNAETNAYLLRRQYRTRLAAANERAAGQYARFSELLSRASELPAPVGASAALLPYRVGMAQRAREGQRVSGDSGCIFETPEGQLCLLLSDGMGSGEEARRESALAVRLIERLLRAGIDAQTSLRTLHDAMSLRAEYSASFTTVDLLSLSLRSGEAEVSKYGAAPSYVKRGGSVRRISCASLPAGLAEDGLAPDVTHLRLGGGSFFVMLSDGVADAADDGWLLDLLARWEGTDPQQLVSAILADSYGHRGAADDALVLAAYLSDADVAPREV